MAVGTGQVRGLGCLCAGAWVVHASSICVRACTNVAMRQCRVVRLQLRCVVHGLVTLMQFGMYMGGIGACHCPGSFYNSSSIWLHLSTPGLCHFQCGKLQTAPGSECVCAVCRYGFLAMVFSLMSLLPMSAFLYMELCTIAAYGWGWVRAWNVLDMVSLGA